jgi:hypothetical protein
MYKFLPILLFAYGLAITTEDIYDNSWALIIGIDKYENVQKLDFAADDAIAMRDILIKSFNFPEDNVTILLNEEATKDNIVKEFSNVAFKAKEGDRVLVFFAGHGETMPLPEGGEMGYLIPVNGDADNLYYSSIAMDELKRLSLMSKAKHMLYLVDACYGGIATVGSRGLSTNTPNYIDKIVSDKARQVITAGGKGEQVIEKSEWGHSAFTLNLKRGLKDKRADLNSDGYITANELGMFLREKVTIDSDNQQTPQYGRMTSQEGEFVFVYSENTVINQNMGDSSTDAKLDLLLSEIEELKSKTNENINYGKNTEKTNEKNNYGKNTEKWYTYWSIGTSAPIFDDDYIKIMKDESSPFTEIKLSIDMFSYYRHLNEKAILGFVINATAHRIEGSLTINNTIFTYDEQVNYYLYGLSYIKYPKIFGSGFYYRGDIGLTAGLLVSNLGNEPYTENYDGGLGLLAGGGYSWNLGGTRILLGAYYSTKSIDGTMSNNFQINLGGLF